MPRKKKLPKYVIIKHEQWHVRRTFKVKNSQFSSGKEKKYDEVVKRCFPETAERAEELAEEIEEAYLSTVVEPAESQTVGEFLEYWLEVKSKAVEMKTFEGYEDLYNRHVKDSPFARKLLAELKPLDIQDFYNSLKCSSFAVRKVHVFLRTAFRQGIKWKKLAENPVDGAVLPAYKQKESPAMSRAEAKRLIEVLKSKPEYLVLEFALETGMRPGEYLALRWSDVDLITKTARVAQAVVFNRTGSEFQFKEPKTSHSRRTITISNELKERLIEHKKTQEKLIKEIKGKIKEPISSEHFNSTKGVKYKERLARRKNFQNILNNFEAYNLVFPSSKGTPKWLKNLGRREFKQALKDAGINSSKYYLYSLRHTNATLLADKLPPRRLQKHLGHSNIVTTLKFYVHVDDEDNYEPSNIFRGLLNA